MSASVGLWGRLAPRGRLPAGRLAAAAVFPLARVGAGLALDGLLAGHRVGADQQFGGLEPLELVAQPRRLLEFEVGGGRAHALLEVGDRGLEVVADRGSRAWPGRYRP